MIELITEEIDLKNNTNNNTKNNVNQIPKYPLESYVTHVSHKNLQGAPTESSENSSIGRIPLRIRKDK